MWHPHHRHLTEHKLPVLRCDVVAKVVVLRFEGFLKTTDNVVVGVVSVVAAGVVVGNWNWWLEVGEDRSLTPLPNEVSLGDFIVVRKVVTPSRVCGQAGVNDQWNPRTASRLGRMGSYQ